MIMWGEKVGAGVGSMFINDLLSALLANTVATAPDEKMICSRTM